MLRITEQLLKDGMSDNGSWNSKQLKALGIDIRFNSGWRRRAIGQPITQEQANRFLALKNYHLERKKRIKRQILGQKRLFRDDIPGMIPYEDYLHMQSIKQELKQA